FRKMGRHVAAVADAKQECAVRPVNIFVHLTRRMHDECARRDVDRFARCAYFAAPFKTEIDFRSVGVAMIWADLARFPAGYCDVAATHAAQNLFDMALWIPFLFPRQAENVHASPPVWLESICLKSIDKVTKTRHAFKAVRSQIVKTISLCNHTNNLHSQRIVISPCCQVSSIEESPNA